MGWLSSRSTQVSDRAVRKRPLGLIFDSPVFRNMRIMSHIMEICLSQMLRAYDTGWREALKKDGYAILPRVVDQDTVAQLIGAISSIETKTRALRRNQSIYGARNFLETLPIIQKLAHAVELRSIIGPGLPPKA